MREREKKEKERENNLKSRSDVLRDSKEERGKRERERLGCKECGTA